ncbi:MAG TPA: DsbA family oxidoreductase [Actinomycetales bacterium]|nr:DsbA family oxidoreductase [Actinomycetales bacterium]
MRIDIWSDIACPWCHIGLARFERVLESFPHRDQVEVRMRSFQLDPTLPESYEGTETEYLAARKGVSEDVIGQMFGHVAQAAQSEGLPLDFDSVRVANSWRAHRLLHAAEAHDPSGALTRRLERALFEAHFRDGESISDPAVLLRLASELGIPDDVARLASGEGTTALPPAPSEGADQFDQSIQADLAEARALGITGVPFFVLAGKYGISGAQPAEVFEGALNQVWEELNPAPALKPLIVPGVVAGEGGGEACGPEGCD